MASCTCMTGKAHDSFDGLWLWFFEVLTKLNHVWWTLCVCGKGPAWVKAISHLSVKTVKWAVVPFPRLLHTAALLIDFASRASLVGGTNILKRWTPQKGIPRNPRPEKHGICTTQAACRYRGLLIQPRCGSLLKHLHRDACVTSKTKDSDSNQLGRRWPNKCTYLSYLMVF